MPISAHRPRPRHAGARGRVLSDCTLAKSGGQKDKPLGACWEETLDAGPYDFESKEIDWSKVLQGDRLFALLQVRALTCGPDYGHAVLNDGAEVEVWFNLSDIDEPHFLARHWGKSNGESKVPRRHG